jgi:hypothetical protein
MSERFALRAFLQHFVAPLQTLQFFYVAAQMIDLLSEMQEVVPRAERPRQRRALLKLSRKPLLERRLVVALVADAELRFSQHGSQFHGVVAAQIATAAKLRAALGYGELVQH